MVQVFLKTERLVLRRFTGADADDLFDLDGDPEVMRFLTGGKPTSRDEIREKTLPRFLGYYERFAGFGFWAAVEKPTGEFLGWFGLHPPESGDLDEVELGYRLRRSVWGKGYATEGSRALIHKGFTDLGVRRVVAQTMAVNTASRRVMEKAGLMHVRTFYPEWPDPIEGSEQGEVEYALTKADWGRREAARERPSRIAGDASNTAEGWDRILSRLDKDAGGGDAWLNRWRGFLEPNRAAPVLALGCGAGEDAGTLMRWGFRVVAVDFSEKALEMTEKRAPGVKTKNVDLTRGLPFPDDHFQAIVASLSLHYFPWLETLDILEEIRRCLAPEGHLLARLNSTRDDQYAAAQKEEVEPNLYLVDGHPKRLFDRRGVNELFARGWDLTSVAERTTGRYGEEKTLWEIIARKTNVKSGTPKS